MKKQFFSIVTATLSLGLLSGCDLYMYEASQCVIYNYIDATPYAGNYTATLTVQGEKIDESVEIVATAPEKGKLVLANGEDKTVYTACNPGDKYVFEQQEKEGDPIIPFLATTLKDKSGYTLTAAMFDKKAVEAMGLKVEVEEIPASQEFPIDITAYYAHNAKSDVLKFNKLLKKGKSFEILLKKKQ